MLESRHIVVAFQVFVLLLILLVVQSNLIPLIQIKGITPDLVLIFIVSWSAQRRGYQGIILGFMAGFLQGLMEGGTLGIFTLSKSVACYVAYCVPYNRYEKNYSIFGVVLFMAAFTHQLIYFVLAYRESSAGFTALFLRYGIPSVFYTVFCGVLISILWDTWHKSLVRRRQSCPLR
jgi:rod shape-determining protein MreD